MAPPGGKDKAKDSSMLELAQMQQLLSEIGRLVASGSRADRRKAADKLQRLVGIAGTLGLTIRPRL